MEQQRHIRAMFAEITWFSCEAVTVAMHFRIGDYAAVQEAHPILTLDYYRRALKHVIQHAPIKHDAQEKINVLIFNQACDNAVIMEHMHQLSTDPAFANRCRFHKVPDMFDDWKQLLLMSVCDNNIIANSTFSWWSAFLMGKNGTVFYPKGRGLPHEIFSKDMVIEGWNSF